MSRSQINAPVKHVEDEECSGEKVTADAVDHESVADGRVTFVFQLVRSVCVSVKQTAVLCRVVFRAKLEDFCCLMKLAQMNLAC